jgi:hypothetical protein
MHSAWDMGRAECCSAALCCSAAPILLPAPACLHAIASYPIILLYPIVWQWDGKTETETELILRMKSEIVRTPPAKSHSYPV